MARSYLKFICVEQNRVNFSAAQYKMGLLRIRWDRETILDETSDEKNLRIPSKRNKKKRRVAFQLTRKMYYVSVIGSGYAHVRGNGVIIRLRVGKKSIFFRTITLRKRWFFRETYF